MPDAQRNCTYVTENERMDRRRGEFDRGDRNLLKVIQPMRIPIAPHCHWKEHRKRMDICHE